MNTERERAQKSGGKVTEHRKRKEHRKAAEYEKGTDKRCVILF